MIAFKISLNGKQVSVAGVGNEGLLAAMITWSKGIDPYHPEESCHMQVTGMRGTPPQTAQMLAWVTQALDVGDTVTVEVINSDETDTPQQLGPPRIEAE